MTSSITAITTKNLTKRYDGKTVVDSLSLNINKGSLFALLGVNGAGKTTTIKMLSCLIKPTSGDALLSGLHITSDSMKIKEIINVSPQETAIAPLLTVRENLEFICGIYGHNRALSRERAKQIMTCLFMKCPINAQKLFLEDGSAGFPSPWL